MALPPFTKLDHTQVLTHAFDESQNRIRVDAGITFEPPSGGVVVFINKDDDSISIYDSNGNPITVGQKTMANSVPVVIASDQTLNVTVTGTQNVNLFQVAGTATSVNNGTTDNGTLRVTLSSDSTGQVKIAAGANNIGSLTNITGTISLPTGASTSALQTTGNTSLASIDSKIPSGLTVTSTRLLVDGSGVTQPVSGTVTSNQGTSPWVENISQWGGTSTSLGQKAMSASVPVVIASDQTHFPVELQDGAGNNLTSQANGGQRALDVGVNVAGVQVDPRSIRTLTSSDTVTVVQPTAANLQVTANAGTNLNTSALALDATVAKLTLAQGSTTTSETGPLIQGAVTTNAPSYSTGNTNPLSLDTSGLLRISLKDTPANTNKFLVTADPITFASPQHVIVDSGSLSVTQGTSPWVDNISQFGGSNVVTGTGNSGAGIPRVTVSNDSSITNISGTISLPTGASTSANQTNGTQKTQVVDGANATVGPVQTISGTNYFPVVQASSATPGAAVVARSTQVAGSDGTNAQTLSTDTTGRLNINLPSNTSPATQNITVQDTGSSVTTGANSQSIITGTPTANSTASFAISTIETIRVQVSGTWTGTLQTEVSPDSGTTWYINGGHQTGTAFNAASFTANFAVSVNVGAATNFRVRATAAMTGTATVKIVESVNENVIYVANPIKIADGTTPSTQATIKAASTAAVATDTSLVVALNPNTAINLPTGAATDASLSTINANMTNGNLRGTVNVIEGTTTAGTPAATTVSTSAVLLKASNVNRKAILITNNSTGNLFIGHTNGVTTSGATMGLIVTPYGSYQDSGAGLYTGDLYGIYSATASSQNVSVSERT